MNESADTRSALLATARTLFARHGYDGTSIRAITAQAHANLGAVTYHFGTKQRLYEAVLESITEPLRARVQAAASSAPSPLEAILAVTRAFSEHLAQHPELPALVLHDLALQRPVPGSVRRTMEEISALVSRLVAAGQRERSIVPGHPILLTASLVAQPFYFSLMRQRLREVFELDAADPEVRQRIQDHVLEFVRRGVATPGRTA
jgi:AcrR family transcriptional regulator